MNSVEIKDLLRQCTFPIYTIESLIVVDNLFIKYKNLPRDVYYFCLEIIDEFVFCERDRFRLLHGTTFNSLEELQVLMLIGDKLSAIDDEARRNTMFWMCFGDTTSPKRFKLLQLLIIMSMSSGCVPIMKAFGVWIQQCGYNRPQMLGVIDRIVTEHFINSYSPTTLRSFCFTAPHFVASFIASVSYLYFKERLGKLKTPPRALLETVIYWISANPDLATVPFDPIPFDNLPKRRILSPINHLMLWCSLAPILLQPESVASTPRVEEAQKDDIYNAICEEMKRRIVGIEETPANVLESEAALYGYLAEAIKVCLAKNKGKPHARSIVETTSILLFVPRLKIYKAEMLKRDFVIDGHPQFEEAIGRMLQLVQVALENGCVNGCISIFVTAFETLPLNMSLKHFVSAYLESGGTLRKIIFP